MTTSTGPTPGTYGTPTSTIPSATYTGTGDAAGNYFQSDGSQFSGAAGGGGYSPGTYLNGTMSSGQQPGGNQYPQGIFGAGSNGGGTALGSIQPGDLTSEWMNKINDPNNPYIKLAMQRAGQQANSRGLLNSSIAAGNAQGAAIQASLPIAEANAQATLGLQTTNLDNLAKIKSANIGAAGQVAAAARSANASMYDTRVNNEGALLRQTDLLGYQGQQADLNYQRQLGLQDNTYTNQLGLQNNEGQISLNNQMYNNMFQLGGNLLLGQQNFSDQVGLKALGDPAILGDPNALMGFTNLINGTSQSYVDSLFNNLFGQYSAPSGGTP